MAERFSALDECGECRHLRCQHPFYDGAGRGCLDPIYEDRIMVGVCSCLRFVEPPVVPSAMSVVDEDRLTRRNPDHLDDWRFR